MKFIKSEAFKMSVLYFVFTRIALVSIGICITHEFAIHGIVKPSGYISSNNGVFSIFGTYDTAWYLRIAEDWYPNLKEGYNHYMANKYTFYPLYPALIRLVSIITHANYFFSGLIISNICLIFSGYFLHKISEKYYDKRIADWSLIFLYAFPVSFILSGVFTESLYLMLILIVFYLASLEKWIVAGFFAMFLTMCRPIGVFVIVPLMLMYLQNINFDLRKISKNILGLFLTFVGILILLIHNYLVAGRTFSVFALYGSDYKLPFMNPFIVLYNWLTSHYFSMTFLAIFTVAFIVCWILFYRHIRIQYHIIIFYSLLVPMCYSLGSMPRMMLVAFPIFILMSSVVIKYKIQNAFLISCVLLQGYMFVCWCLGFGNVI